MSRKQYSKELKLELLKKHLEDGISYWKLGKEYGIEASIIRRWGHKSAFCFSRPSSPNVSYLCPPPADDTSLNSILFT